MNTEKLKEMKFTEIVVYAESLGIEIPKSIRSKDGVLEYLESVQETTAEKILQETTAEKRSLNEVKLSNDPIASLSLEELQDLVAERGILYSPDDSKEKLILLLTGENVNLSQEKEDEAVVQTNKTAVVISEGVQKIQEAELQEGEALPGVLMDKDFYKKHFEKSPKRRVIIPFVPGETRSFVVDGKTQYPRETISINGFAISIQKGVYVDIPTEFADVVEGYTQFAVENELDLANASSDKLQYLS